MSQDGFGKRGDARVPARHPDRGGARRVVLAGGVAVLAVMALALIAPSFGLPLPGPSGVSGATPDGGQTSPLPNEITRAVAAAGQVLPGSTSGSPAEVGTILFRLVLAALLGLAISFRGSRRRNEAQIVHTNMILAFTGAMMMIVVGSDLARAFGLVGASSIVRYRTPVHDPQALASLFVSMGAGIAVGVGLYELAILATILVVVIEFALARVSKLASGGAFRAERAYELALETETPDQTLQAVRQLFNAERMSNMLMEYDRGKKSETTTIGLTVGVPDGANTEELTLQILGAGARSVSWRLAKES